MEDYLNEKIFSDKEKQNPSDFDFKQEFSESSTAGRYLTFVIAEEKYCIEIRYITEIINLPKIIQVPELPEYMPGIISLRGKIIPVIDSRVRFGKPCTEFDERTCVIILDISEYVIGFIVEKVDEVIKMNDSNIEQSPSIEYLGNRFIKSIGKINDQVVIVLDPEKILTEKQINQVQQKLEEQA